MTDSQTNAIKFRIPHITSHDCLAAVRQFDFREKLHRLQTSTRVRQVFPEHVQHVTCFDLDEEHCYAARPRALPDHRLVLEPYSGLVETIKMLKWVDPSVKGLLRRVSTG